MRDPLLIADAQRRELQFILDTEAEHPLGEWIRIPLSDTHDQWLSFKKQMSADTVLYSFTTDRIDWSLLGARLGYVPVHQGEMVTMLTTGLN